MADVVAVPALEIRRTFNAPRERVFAAWTRPEHLSQWAAPGPMTGNAEVDLRVGGRYRIVMSGPDGATRIVGGTYRVVDAPAKLVYTWQWLDRENATEMLITVEFTARGNATDVVLRHEGFSTERDRAAHEQGWNGCVVKLENLLH